MLLAAVVGLGSAAAACGVTNKDQRPDAIFKICGIKPSKSKVQLDKVDIL